MGESQLFTFCPQATGLVEVTVNWKVKTIEKSVSFSYHFWFWLIIFSLVVHLEHADSFTGSSTALPNHFTQVDEDVNQEENSIKQAARESSIEDDIAVQLRGLAKTYSKRVKIDCQRCCFCCFYCKCKVQKSFDAVRVRILYMPKVKMSNKSLLYYLQKHGMLCMTFLWPFCF